MNNGKYINLGPKLIMQQEGNHINQKEEDKSSFVALRPHFFYTSISEVEKALTSTNIKKIQNDEEEITVGGSLKVVVKKKILSKPLHLLRLKKRINKKTRQITYRIKDSNVIKVIYDYEDMCDFVSSEGIQILKNSSPYVLEKQDLLQLVRDQLEKKLKGQKCDISDQEFKSFIRPQAFLKGFNLAPPKCDFFINKARNESKLNNSISISFQDPIPSCPFQIPSSMAASQLFQIVQKFLAKRPCWLKNTLLFSLRQDGTCKFTINQLKNTLKYVCYTFKNGPWKHTFCAFGFNPKANSKAVIYQNVSLKLKKKEAQDYQQEVEQQVYDPSFTDISTRCMRAYQLADIAIDEIKQILNGKLISQQTTCTKENGWLSPTQQAYILKAMKNYKQNKVKA